MDVSGTRTDPMPTDRRQEHKYLFGPVPSRRLGRSLGVDAVPFKTCTYDCVYCQLGPTTGTTCDRAQYVPAAEMIADLRAWLANGRDVDYITLSGSGEPCLNSDIRDVIAWIKAHTSIPVAVLTNGALLSRDDVRHDLSRADLLMPSLDAVTQACFERVNRPGCGLEVEDVLRGLVALRREFTGQIWLEVMLIEGLNDSGDDLHAMRGVIDDARPDRVQINTVVRPPAESWVRPISASALRAAKRTLGPSAEIIAPVRASALDSADDRALPTDILQMLRRRPCTLADIALGLGVHRNWVSKHLPRLLESGHVITELRGESTYYRIA